MGSRTNHHVRTQRGPPRRGKSERSNRRSKTWFWRFVSGHRLWPCRPAPKTKFGFSPREDTGTGAEAQTLSAVGGTTEDRALIRFAVIAELPFPVLHTFRLILRSEVEYLTHTRSTA
jgi:hypothetical protein